MDALEDFKKVDQAYEETKYADRFANVKYVERETDPELK